MFMKHLVLLFSLSLWVVCWPSHTIEAQQPASEWTAQKPSRTFDDVLIHFEAGACRGYCPIFKLTFLTDGTLQYAGLRNVLAVGDETAKLSAEEFSELQNAVRRANLHEQPAQIPSDIVDAPKHTFYVYHEGKRHRVMGSRPLPEPIQALDDLMQDIAEAHGFMVKKGVDPDNPSAMTGQVRVVFKPEVNAGNFCMQFMEIKSRPVRRVSEQNIWLIGFNPSELTEVQFINILQSMEGVVDASSVK